MNRSPGSTKLVVFIVAALLFLLLLNNKRAAAAQHQGDGGNAETNQEMQREQETTGQEEGEQQDGGKNEGNPEADPGDMKITPEAVRDAIASLLREGSPAGSSEDGKGGGDDGYTEAAQEYLEHVQSVLANVKSPSELYVRDQLADLETLHDVLAALEANASLTPSVGARLVAHLVKGPARQLLLPLAAGAAGGFPAAYAGSELAGRLADTAAELRRFLAATSASLTDDLRRHADGVEQAAAARPVRDYLDALLDRVLRLEGKQVRVNVEWPTGEGGLQGEPKVSPAEPEPDDADGHQGTSDADADEGGRRLFDQVLGRRAVASVAARLAEAGGGRAAAAARIEELRQRRYQPAGMEVMLEAIEQSLRED